MKKILTMKCKAYFGYSFEEVVNLFILFIFRVKKNTFSIIRNLKTKLILYPKINHFLISYRIIILRKHVYSVKKCIYTILFKRTRLFLRSTRLKRILYCVIKSHYFYVFRKRIAQWKRITFVLKYSDIIIEEMLLFLLLIINYLG